MKVTMNIGKNTADVDIQDMNETEFLRLVFCAVRVVAITCLEAGAEMEDIEPVIMAEVCQRGHDPAGPVHHGIHH